MPNTSKTSIRTRTATHAHTPTPTHTRIRPHAHLTAPLWHEGASRSGPRSRAHAVRSALGAPGKKLAFNEKHLETVARLKDLKRKHDAELVQVQRAPGSLLEKAAVAFKTPTSQLRVSSGILRVSSRNAGYPLGRLKCEDLLSLLVRGCRFNRGCDEIWFVPGRGPGGPPVPTSLPSRLSIDHDAPDCERVACPRAQA